MKDYVPQWSDNLKGINRHEATKSVKESEQRLLDGVNGQC